MEDQVDDTIQQINALHTADEILEAVVKGEKAFLDNTKLHDRYLLVRDSSTYISTLLLFYVCIVSGVEILRADR